MANYQCQGTSQLIRISSATTKYNHADKKPNRCLNTASQSDGHPATASRNGANCPPWQQSSTAPQCRCRSTRALWRPRWPSLACLISKTSHDSDIPRLLKDVTCLLSCKLLFSTLLLSGGKRFPFLLIFFGRCYSMIPTFAREHRTFSGFGRERLSLAVCLGFGAGNVLNGENDIDA